MWHLEDQKCSVRDCIRLTNWNKSIEPGISLSLCSKQWFALKSAGAVRRAAQVGISKHLYIICLHVKQNLVVCQNLLTVSLHKLILHLCNLVKYKALNEERAACVKPQKSLCVWSLHNSVKPALDIAHLHEMKSLHFRRDCHQAGDKNVCFPARCGSLYPPHYAQSAPITSSFPPIFFTPVFVLFLLLLLFTGKFWAEDWGKMNSWLYLSAWESRFSLIHDGPEAGEWRDPLAQEDKRSGQTGKVNPGVKGSSAVRLGIGQIKWKKW